MYHMVATLLYCNLKSQKMYDFVSGLMVLKLIFVVMGKSSNNTVKLLMLLKICTCRFRGQTAYFKMSIG